MAIQFPGPIPKETALRFVVDLPGTDRKFEVEGEWAWEGHLKQAGVRFKDIAEEQRELLRQWLNSQLPELEQDDPPVTCVLTDLSPGGCYLKTTSPFPQHTRVTLSIRVGDIEVQAGGLVRVVHPEYGMGVEFVQVSTEQRDRVHQLIEALRAKGNNSPELQVHPEGIEHPADPAMDPQVPGLEDPLVELFRSKAQAPVEAFLEQLREQRQTASLQ
jgi:hypothetical protein